MMDKTIQKKLKRLSISGQPTVLDLFSGCGGLTLGYVTAGFKSFGAVEIDQLAAQTHAKNFFNHLPPKEFEVHAKARDITAIEPEELLLELGYSGAPQDAIDVVIGGPPCQSFARVGRAKLREVADHPEAFLKDPRSNLYLRFLHYVKVLRPICIMMENVPDVLNHGGHNVAEETCELLSEWGYKARYTLLNAVFFGVPQMRERMFLVAVHEDVGQEVTFPAPTHWIELPKGYEGSRQVALKNLKRNLLNFSEESFYIERPVATPKKMAAAVTAEQALNDLPPITDHLEGRLRRGARRFINSIPYGTTPKNKYQRLMRSWPGFEASEGIADHVIRFLPRDYKLFRRMNPGDQYPQAHAHAIAMFEEHCSELAANGVNVAPGSKSYKELWAEFVPPYDPGKFPNKWRKMERDKPARTLMAHLGKDCYSHIHYDSSQARTISVREGARLQSFPDGFIFEGTMNPALRQVGNAVPPLMAFSIARHIMTILRGKHVQKISSKKTDSIRPDALQMAFC